jgi:hypothetical protein
MLARKSWMPSTSARTDSRTEHETEAARRAALFLRDHRMAGRRAPNPSRARGSYAGRKNAGL